MLPGGRPEVGDGDEAVGAGAERAAVERAGGAAGASASNPQSSSICSVEALCNPLSRAEAGGSPRAAPPASEGVELAELSLLLSLVVARLFPIFLSLFGSASRRVAYRPPREKPTGTVAHASWLCGRSLTAVYQLRGDGSRGHTSWGRKSEAVDTSSTGRAKTRSHGVTHCESCLFMGVKFWAWVEVDPVGDCRTLWGLPAEDLAGALAHRLTIAVGCAFFRGRGCRRAVAIAAPGRLHSGTVGVTVRYATTLSRYEARGFDPILCRMPLRPTGRQPDGAARAFDEQDTLGVEVILFEGYRRHVSPGDEHGGQFVHL